MLSVTSISGGKTSAFVGANYPSDHLLFALVRVEDPECMFPDKKIRQLVEDRIHKPFVGTVEDDTIIYTILDLEQYYGRPINWVSGMTYEQVLKEKGGWLPNKLHRYCTYFLKIEPMFYWWQKNISDPVLMQIGFRANEISRANDTLAKTNTQGLLEFKGIIGKSKNGKRNRWDLIPWQKPAFPLIEDNVYKDEIISYWKNKPVRFAEYNNCVGCFHRNPYFLKYMFGKHQNKMNWFAKQEMGRKKGTWKTGVRYESIDKILEQGNLFVDEFQGCDDGFCEV
ncbi:MAG TPA: hypothetical protein VF487_20405 [Chitinophagaceae bacterium]